MEPLYHWLPAGQAPPDRFARLDDPQFRREIIDQFHYLYYHVGKQTWTRTSWLGALVYKCPLDLWIYQEMLWELLPDVVIETGTFSGGGALYLATICDLVGAGRVYTIDTVERAGRPVHPRLEYLHGSSTSDEVFDALRRRIGPDERVLVILDSDHSQRHVREELERYSPLIQPGGYLIVEDTNVNGHPVRVSFGPGPMEAVEEFLRDHPEFESDVSRERLFLTFNPRGYLKRIGGTVDGSSAPRASAVGRPAGASASIATAEASSRDHAMLRQEVAALGAAAAERDKYLRSLEADLRTIYGSRLWRAGQWYRRVCETIGLGRRS